MWQTGSSSYLWSAIVGPAGRRREASFSGGLARSLAQGGQCLSDVVGGGTGAACLREGEIWVGEVTAGWGGAGGGGGGGGRGGAGGDRGAGQPRRVSVVEQCRDGRRRGRLGNEAAVSL